MPRREMDSYTHDLGSLVIVAGLKVALDGMLTGKRAAHDLYEAVTDPVSGVLPWVKSFW